MFEQMTEQQARDQILEMVSAYCDTYHNKKKDYVPGDRISYAARVYDHEEMVNLVDSALEFWLTSGRYTEQFEKEFAGYLGLRFCSLVNSGSSANLLAFMALTSPLLGERQIRPEDEVITVAAGFPTTVAPVVQYGAVPVFVDVTIPQYNIDVTGLEEALSGRTKAVMLAHTLGNPFDLKAVKAFCETHNLWLIEDNCDALGSVYTWNGGKRFTGTIGDIGTSSFYPSHHMTMGDTSVVLDVQHTETSAGLGRRYSRHLPVGLVICEKLPDIHIGNSVPVGEHKGLLIQILADPFDTSAGHSPQSGINYRHFPRFRNVIMYDSSVSLCQVKGHVTVVQEIVCKPLFYHVLLIAAADHKFVKSIMGI